MTKLQSRALEEQHQVVQRHALNTTSAGKRLQQGTVWMGLEREASQASVSYHAPSNSQQLQRPGKIVENMSPVHVRKNSTLAQVLINGKPWGSKHETARQSGTFKAGVLSKSHILP